MPLGPPPDQGRPQALPHRGDVRDPGGADSGDDRGLQEELGDLLFHIIFMARIAEEEGAFDIDDVTHGVAEKMRRRHPHVFGSSAVSGPHEVEANWA
ncbi:MAG: hypothetical protein MUO24_12030, partial [Desulfobacterales bacterium]|nr:hypothetical protein [Desulfobacterales bacterium]